MSDSSLVDWLNTLSPEDREKFLEMVKDENTYIAEDMTDVLAILESLPKKTN